MTQPKGCRHHVEVIGGRGRKAYPNIAVGLMVGPMDPTTPSSGSQRAVGTLLCQSHNPMCGKLTCARLFYLPRFVVRDLG